MAKNNNKGERGEVPPRMPPKRKPETDVGGGATPPSMPPQRPKPRKDNK